MNEQVVPEKTGTLTIDAVEYARIVQKLDQLSMEVEETRALLRRATGHEPEQSKWYRKPGMLEGAFKLPDDFFDDLTDEDYRRMGFNPDEL